MCVDHLGRATHILNDHPITDGDIHHLSVDAPEGIDDAGVPDQKFTHPFHPSSCISAYIRERTSSSEGYSVEKIFLVLMGTPSIR